MVIIFILVIGITVAYSFSRESGWKDLADTYKCDNEFNGNLVKNISAKLQGSNRLNGVLNIGINKEFLYLSINPIFRLFSPSLLIPLNEVSFSNAEENILFKFKIQFKKHPELYVCITTKSAKKLGVELKSNSLNE